MKAWLFDYYPPNNTIEFRSSDDLELIYEALSSDQPMIQEWSALTVDFEDTGRPADILNRFNGALVISKKVKDILEQQSIEQIEFLPILTDAGEAYYILHVLNIIDCIDTGTSKVRMVHGDTNQFDEYSLVLHAESLEQQHMFRIKYPQKERTLPYIYVSDSLQDMLSASIVGYQLVEIWDSEFSWKEKEEEHERMSKEIDKSLMTFFDFEQAKKFARKNKGKMVLSGKWAIKADKDKQIWLGNLQLDGSYSWMVPSYYPPVLLGLRWGIVEKRDTWFSRLGKGFTR